MNDALLNKYKEWLDYDKNEKSRKEIEELHKCNNIEILQTLLMKRMEFGTAGLRARMGPGNSQMNDLTIIQTSQGLLEYCKSCFPDLKTLGIVIGYDGRYNSDIWAKILANIFARSGCKVYLYSKLCPTPFVPFGVLHYKTACGVMITASHNPKEDNGYKVYWSNGAQIISPHDKGISKHIEENLKPWSTSWDFQSINENPLVHDPLDEISLNYYTKQKNDLCFHFDSNCKSDLKFTYTAMHGVGYKYVEKMFETFGFQHMVPVVEQIQPDPEFPTVKFPNPEEGKSALDLSIKTADKAGSPIILANDPDADRLAVAEKHKDGKWKIFKGNEIGALLGWWMWHSFSRKNPSIKPSNCFMFSSTVSSKILRAIAKKEGFQFEETLTGFKWMGNAADKYLKEGKHVVFAFEEAIGFMCGNQVLDKDGVGALGAMGELAIDLYRQGKNLHEKLKEIYIEYGYHTTNDSYYFCYDPDIIKRIFLRMRNISGGDSCQDYPKSCGPYSITSVRDLNTGYDSNYDDKKARLPVSKSSEMVTFTFSNGCVATIRTSGTEPKIKYYSEYCANPDDKREWHELDQELHDLVSHLVKDLYQPEENKLTARSDK